MRPITKEACVNEDKSLVRSQSSSDNQPDSPYRYTIYKQWKKQVCVLAKVQTQHSNMVGSNPDGIMTCHSAYK